MASVDVDDLGRQRTAVGHVDDLVSKRPVVSHEHGIVRQRSAACYEDDFVRKGTVVSDEDRIHSQTITIRQTHSRPTWPTGGYQFVAFSPI